MSTVKWISAVNYSDIKYEKCEEGIAKITINRPEVRNAFRPLTAKEMIQALAEARDDAGVGVIILTGEGKKAFCSGGDQRVRGEAGYVDDEGEHRLVHILPLSPLSHPTSVVQIRRSVPEILLFTPQQ